MKAFLAKIFGANWTTNIPATGFALCASSELLGLLPDAYEKIALSFCALMVTSGFFAAKSSNVSNSPTPVAAAVVQPAAAATPNPGAVQ